MRARKGKPLGMYGNPTDFLNHIRKPGDDDMPLITEKKKMDNQMAGLGATDPMMRKRRDMNKYGIRQ